MAVVSPTSSKSYKLDSLRHWDVKVSPAEQKEVAGRLMPTLRGSFGRFGFAQMTRRITIETYGIASDNIKAHDSVDESERNFNKLMGGESQKGAFKAKRLGENEVVIFRMFKAKAINDDQSTSHQHDDGDWDDQILTAISAEMDVGEVTNSREYQWHERYKIRLFHVHVVSVSEKSCRLKLGVGGKTKVRTFSFQSKQDKESFLNVARAMKALQKERADRLAAAYREKLRRRTNLLQLADETTKAEDTLITSTRSEPIPEQKVGFLPRSFSPVKIQRKKLLGDSLLSWDSGGKGVVFEDSQEDEEGTNYESPIIPSGKKISPSKVSKGFSKLRQFISRPACTNSLREDVGAHVTIDLLLEIVSACNLPVADASKCNPYVRVFDGRVAVHRTKHVAKTLNPVWTLSTGCFVLFRQSVDAFFETNHLVFEIRDHDTIGVHPTIGTVNVGKQGILSGTGERVEYKISLEGGFTDDRSNPSLLSLRFRHATKADIEFIEGYEKNRRRNKRAVFADESFLGPKIHSKLTLRKQTRKERHGVEKYLVKPRPDPQRPESSKWMSVDEIESEVVKPSRGWIESGSGNLGKVYCEVLSCDKLPNLDFSMTGGNKTDPFVCIVYEDSIVHTDVLDNILAPRWMPWTQRAFVFKISHPNSQIFIGVFDYDRTDPNHDIVGRATCNITNFHPGTIHTVEYNLHYLNNLQKKVRGKITLRVRVEWESERNALLAGYPASTDPHHVSVAKRQFFRTVGFTLTNEPSPYQLNLNTISNYITELWTYWDFSHINEYFWSLLLWKSHFRVHLALPFSEPRHLYIPLRSMIAFSWGIALSRNIELLPSFVAFSVAWMLIATHDGQCQRPNVWQQPRGYFDLLAALLFDRTRRYPRIGKFHDHDRVRRFQQIEKAIKQSQEEVLKIYYEEQDKFYTRAAETSLGTADLDIATQASGGISDIFMVPFIPILLPVQLWLHWVCRMLRIAKGVVLWRDSYKAFWLVTANLATSFIFIWIPWTFILRWLLKIFVWVFLGPWMKLVDILYCKYKTRYEKTDEEIKGDLNEELKQLRNQWSGWSNERKIIFEKARKDKDMKEYMFGSYVMAVPKVKEEFDYDDPLPSSSAEPIDSEEGRSHCNVNIVDRKHGQQLFGTMIPLREKDIEETQAGDGQESDDTIVFENDSDDESDWVISDDNEED